MGRPAWIDAMQLRTLVITRDDPEQPGLLIRRYARVRVCWEASFGDWGWQLLNAAGEPACAMVGPFPAGEAAFEDAIDRLGGYWEAEEVVASP
jgi:hypothetical protein